jgi:hypothetical protein
MLLLAPAVKIATVNTVEPGYNDIGLYDTSFITSDVLWYRFLPPRPRLWSRSRKEFLGGVGVGKNVPTPTPTSIWNLN